MKRILVVDDKWAMRDLIKMPLSKHYEVIEVDNGFDAIAKIEETKPELVIIDIKIPQKYGWVVCKSIRNIYKIPILIVTAQGDLKELIRALEIGADDYLPIPFAPEDLIARVYSIMRRNNTNEQQGSERSEISIGEMLIDLQFSEVFIKGKLVNLTPKEFNLLKLFVMNPQRVFSRDDLLDKVWCNYNGRDKRTVDSHIKNLREKFRKTNLSFNPIKTVWGVGYRLGKLL